MDKCLQGDFIGTLAPLGQIPTSSCTQLKMTFQQGAGSLPGAVIVTCPGLTAQTGIPFAPLQARPCRLFLSALISSSEATRRPRLIMSVPLGKVKWAKRFCISSHFLDTQAMSSRKVGGGGWSREERRHVSQVTHSAGAPGSQGDFTPIA